MERKVAEWKMKAWTLEYSLRSQIGSGELNQSAQCCKYFSPNSIVVVVCGASGSSGTAATATAAVVD